MSEKFPTHAQVVIIGGGIVYAIFHSLTAIAIYQVVLLLAGGAFVSIDVAGLLFEPQVKSTRLPTHIEDIGIGQNLDIGMIGQFRQFGTQHARRAIIGGKGFVQLGHDTAHIGLFFYQMHSKTGIGNIQSGLDTGNATADNGDRSDLFFMWH